MRFEKRATDSEFALVLPTEGSPLFLATGICREEKRLGCPATGASDDAKYVAFEKIASIFSRMDEGSVPVIYQRLPRIHRKLFLHGTAGRPAEKPACRMPVSISDRQIAFIILAKTGKRQYEVRQALQDYTRSHLEICDA